MQMFLYDTTLRDGAQREGISFSVEDKLKLARELDSIGFHYIEGGLPGSNPKDAEFFQRARHERFAIARLAAIGSTRHANMRPEDDVQIQALVAAQTPVVTLMGKSSALHVEKVLETTPDENLRMIAESVALFKRLGKAVVYNAEHFFDGARIDAGYALATVTAAANAGADWIVLCDTNGGALPDEVTRQVQLVRQHLEHLPTIKFGFHGHDDGGLALANALAAVQAGCVQVQGAVNGYGERCGIVDLIPLVATLQMKRGYTCVSAAQLRRLSELSHFVAAVANLQPDDYAPYVGRSAFAHKSGLHVTAMARLEESYQHIDPRLVGNTSRVLVSELAGSRNVRTRAEELGLKLDGSEKLVLARVKELESQGFQFEAAEGSFEMLVRRSAADYRAPFELLDFTVIVEKRGEREVQAQATVKVRVGDEVMHTAAEGDGPVNALDRAIRKALLPHYPQLDAVKLIDYKVRIIDEHRGTAARPQVLILSARGDERWSTVGCSHNIIEASYQALWDSLELPLLRSAVLQ
jgi:2-isopropylmalate synthase